MKRVLASVTLLLAVAALRPTAVTAQAITDRQQFSFSDVVSCANGGAGETVDISGEYNSVAHVVQSASGNLVNRVSVSAHGTAVGQTSGNRYVFNSQSRDHLFTGNPLPLNALFAFKAQLVGKGGAGNQWVSGNVHIVLNANGELSSYVENFRFECR